MHAADFKVQSRVQNNKCCINTIKNGANFGPIFVCAIEKTSKSYIAPDCFDVWLSHSYDIMNAQDNDKPYHEYPRENMDIFTDLGWQRSSNNRFNRIKKQLAAI